MKVMIVKELMTGDVSPVAMFCMSSSNRLCPRVGSYLVSAWVIICIVVGAVSGIYVGVPAYQCCAVGISPPRHLIFGINEDCRCPLLVLKNKDRMDGIRSRGKEQHPVFFRFL